MMYFVSFSANYIDEFDLWSAALMTVEEYDYYATLLAKVDETMSKWDVPFEFYFGTDEYLLFDSFLDLGCAISVAPVTDEIAETMKRIMFHGGDCLPNFLTIENLHAWLNRFPDDLWDDEDEDEDDEGAEWE